MKQFPPHILLVNPWITDFAAFNLWSRPLGLLEIGGKLRDAGFRVSLIDCVDAENFSVSESFNPKVNSYGTGKFRRTPISKPGILGSVPRRFCRYGISPKDFLAQLSSLPPPHLILVTSIMTYWYPGVRECINLLREVFPDTPIWLGGNYASLLPGHALKVCGPDRVISGPFIPRYLEDILSVAGRPNPPRSPEKAGLPFWEGYSKHHFICVRASFGCPFHCAYCASNLLSPTFEERAPEAVAREILRESEYFGVKDFAFYDDALLVNAKTRLIPLLKSLLRQGSSLRFHTPNGIHIRLITSEIAELMRATGFHTLRLSLEATQPTLQRRFGSKTSLEEFDQALSWLFEAGFTEREIRVYLLVGLPDQRLREVVQSIREVLKRGVRPSLAEYSPIPGTVLWKDACRVSPYPIEEEPLTHNNSLLPCGGGEITKAVLDDLKRWIHGDPSLDIPEERTVESVFPFQEETHQKHAGEKSTDMGKPRHVGVSEDV